MAKKKAKLALGLKPKGGRLLKLNGTKAKSFDALLRSVPQIAMTPSMDGIFLASPQTRRQFLDDFVFLLFPEHLKTKRLYEATRKKAQSIA